MSSQKGHMRYFTEEAEYVSLEDGQRPKRRLIFQAGVGENGPVLAATLLGLFCCIGVISYTSWLGHQVLVCPDWAMDCKVHGVAKWMVNNLALGQGIVTIFYVIGLVSLAYAVQHISETAIWPIHSRQPLTLDQIDTYLMIVRGAIPPSKTLFDMLKSIHASLFLTSTIVTTLIPFAAAPIIGASYARIWVQQPVQSQYKVGGGIGRLYAQVNPPVSVGAESLSAYISWSRGLSAEPLPDYRNFIIDRSNLSERGTLTARAVRVNLQIHCYPFELMELQSPKVDVAVFATRMATRNTGSRRFNSSENVEVRIAETMAIWMDDYEFVHRNRSRSSLVFAAFNGTIQSGVSSHLSRAASGDFDTTISSIACDVDVELMDGIVTIGAGGPPDAPMATLSSMAGIHISYKNSTTDESKNTLNENALWFAAAPIVVCPTVDGKQPMYYRDTDSNNSLPTGYTKAPFRTFESGPPNNDWTIAELTQFINVTVGATALASSQNFRDDHPQPAIITSLVRARRMDPKRVVYLAIPVIIILLIEAILMYQNTVMHNEEGITVMRMGRMKDIVANLRPTSISAFPNSTVSSFNRSMSGRRPISQASSIKGVEFRLERLPEYSGDDNDNNNYEPVRDVESMLGKSKEDLSLSLMREPVQSPSSMELDEFERSYDIAATALLRPESHENAPASPPPVESRQLLQPRSHSSGVERFQSLHPGHHYTIGNDP